MFHPSRMTRSEQGSGAEFGPRIVAKLPVVWSLLGLLLISPAALFSAPADGPSEDSSAASAASSQNGEEAPTFVDQVTVTATKSELPIKDTPGHVDVIGRDDIENLGYTSVQDLILFTPGVYVDGDLTRLGSGGFNIRGVGGNRVQTRIDGVPSAEQFDFGPFSAQQFFLDVDTLASAEIVRSAGSALYGSDALGGVVSLVTRSPRSYLGNDNQHLGLRVGFDGRADELSESLVFARGGQDWAGSIFYTHRDGDELDNQGDNRSENFLRTAPNPIDRSSNNVLLKLERDATNSSILRLAAEYYDTEAETQVFSSQAPASPFSSAVLDFDAVDTQERLRLSARQSLVRNNVAFDTFGWNVYWQESETDQVTDEVREGFLGVSQRDGVFAFDQETFGIDLDLSKAFGAGSRQTLTYGLQARRDTFDGLRDRTEFLVGSGAPVPTSLNFPTKYFPESDVEELGLFAQGELILANGRVRLVPGVRYDRFELDPSQNDTIFLEGNPGQPDPVGITDEAVSPKLGVVVSLSSNTALFAQYAGGFRAPPMSDVNNGFTNLAGGYRTLPNADLEPETSDNFELGFRAQGSRGSFSITGFDNRYDDFIEISFLGFNPTNFLLEFQAQNVNEVEISGIEAAGDVRFGESWRLRAAYSYVEGDNVSIDEPLTSIAPSRLVTGLRYARPGSRWGAEAVATFGGSKSSGDLPEGSTQFQAPSYEVFDLAAWFSFNERFALQLSGRNLTDETYFEWPFVRGRNEGDPVIDRYSSPGRSFGAQVRTSF